MAMKIIDKMLIQTAVYWGAPVAGGRGSSTFATAIEISVRWEDTQELFIDKFGVEKTSKAIVYVGQDVVVGGFLYLGELTDLDSNHSDPQIIDGAHEIRAFGKLPTLKGDQFLRTTWL